MRRLYYEIQDFLPIYNCHDPILYFLLCNNGLCCSFYAIQRIHQYRDRLILHLLFLSVYRSADALWGRPGSFPPPVSQAFSSWLWRNFYPTWHTSQFHNKKKRFFLYVIHYLIPAYLHPHPLSTLLALNLSMPGSLSILVWHEALVLFPMPAPPCFSAI